MNKIITVILIIFLSVSSVSTCQKKVNNIVTDKTMIETADTLNRRQLDSLFTVDTLSFNIDEDWIKSQVLTEDRKDFLYKYVYIKSMTDSTGVVYTLCSYKDTLFIINKRIVK